MHIDACARDWLALGPPKAACCNRGLRQKAPPAKHATCNPPAPVGLLGALTCSPLPGFGRPKWVRKTW
eukprot:1515765-Pyramimonas_sp.AAC.1